MSVIEMIEKGIDELLAIVVVVPIVGVLCWLALQGKIEIDSLVDLVKMVLVYYFVKKSVGKQ